MLQTTICLLSATMMLLWTQSQADDYGKCRDGYHNFHGVCIYFSKCTDKLTHDEARAACNYIGGALGEPRWPDMHGKFIAMVDKKYGPSSKIHTGVIYNQSLGHWVGESDGAILDIVNRPPMNTKKCSVLIDGLLVAADCDEELPYVCTAMEVFQPTCLRAVLDVWVVDLLQQGETPVSHKVNIPGYALVSPEVTISYSFEGLLGRYGNYSTNIESNKVEVFITDHPGVPCHSDEVTLHIEARYPTSYAPMTIVVKLNDTAPSEAKKVVVNIVPLLEVYVASILWDFPDNLGPVFLQLEYLTSGSSGSVPTGPPSTFGTALSLNPADGFLIVNVIDPQMHLDLGNHIILSLTAPQSMGGQTLRFDIVDGYGAGQWVLGLKPSEGKIVDISFNILRYYDPNLFNINTNMEPEITEE